MFFFFFFFKVRAWKLKQTEGASRVCTSTKDSDPRSQSTSGSGSGSPAFICSSGSHAVLLLNLIARRSSRRHKFRLTRSGLRLYTKVSDKWQRYLLVLLAVLDARGTATARALSAPLTHCRTRPVSRRQVTAELCMHLDRGCERLII